jgi:integrase/recombinase XerC
MDAVADDAARVVAYLTHVRVEKRLAARTVALYERHLQDLCHRAHAQGLTLGAVRAAHVRRWVAQLHAAGREPRGIALVLSSWRGFYDWLGRQGGIAQHPLQGVRAPKAPRPLPKALPVEAALQLVQGAPPPAPTASPQAQAEALRDHAMVELLYGCGLRIGELLGLDLQPGRDGGGWIDLAAGEVHVVGKGGKRRSVPMGPPAVAALTAWLRVRPTWVRGTDPGAVFLGARGERLTPQVARRRLAAWSAQAGVGMHVHPHVLRHSFASHVLQSSGDLRGVQELLGHASIASTQVYTRLDFQHLSRIYEAAHPRARRTVPAPTERGCAETPARGEGSGNPGV